MCVNYKKGCNVMYSPDNEMDHLVNECDFHYPICFLCYLPYLKKEQAEHMLSFHSIRSQSSILTNEELCGIQQGKDFSKVIPSQLLYLVANAEDDSSTEPCSFENYFYYQYVEEKLMMYDSDITECPRCSYNVTKGTFECHLNYECDENFVYCPYGCPYLVLQKEMNNHLLLECVWFEVPCNYCGKSILAKEENEHLRICEQFAVDTCLCRERVRYSEMVDHLSSNHKNIQCRKCSGYFNIWKILQHMAMCYMETPTNPIETNCPYCDETVICTNFPNHFLCTCQVFLINCYFCKSSVLYRSYFAHLLSNCPDFFVERCPRLCIDERQQVWCKLEDHYLSCSEYINTCPKCGKSNMNVDEIYHHRFHEKKNCKESIECQLCDRSHGYDSAQPVQCKFCNKEVYCLELQVHLEGCAKLHKHDWITLYQPKIHDENTIYHWAHPGFRGRCPYNSKAWNCCSSTCVGCADVCVDCGKPSSATQTVCVKRKEIEKCKNCFQDRHDSNTTCPGISEDFRHTQLEHALNQHKNMICKKKK
eukprot:TRINITY_DN16950_c0_g1_i2.p1 TRINITY_DN16950_c0_g1~~TRINITY_DN16950_c0_g1_i2.p1  ORF type:complete len:534 (-),score=74.97 TRINITY_DN16950_c0_g1_i2:21-1622(-)